MIGGAGGVGVDHKETTAGPLARSSRLVSPDEVFEPDYVAPDTLTALLSHPALSDPQCRFLAGGQSLVPDLLSGSAAPRYLMDLGRIPELKKLEVSPQEIWLGAMLTFAEILQSTVVTYCPAIGAALGYVGTATIRNRATVGGSLAWADPRSELALALLVHKAVIVTSVQEMSVSELITGAFHTSLQPGELILGVRITPEPDVSIDFLELIDRNSAGKMVVAAAMSLHPHSGEWRLAVGGLVDRPSVSGPLTAIDEDVPHMGAVERWLDGLCTERPALDDPFHSASYRRKIASVLARRMADRLRP